MKTLSTTILHEPRKRLGITNDVYTVADLIFKLQSGPRASFPGWCNAEKKKISDMLDIPERTLKRYIKILKDKGICRTKTRGKLIQTTALWYDNVILYNSKNQPQRPVIPSAKVAPQQHLECQNDPSPSAKVALSECQNDPPRVPKLPSYIIGRSKDRSEDRSEGGITPAPNLLNKKNVENSNSVKNSPPQVAARPPANVTLDWLDCQKVLIDFFASEAGQGQRQMMCEQVGFDETRHGNFSDVLKVFSEKNQDDYQFLTDPVQAFRKRGHNWLRTQIRIKKADNHGNSRVTKVDNRQPQPNRNQLLERYYARQNNRSDLGEGTTESEPVRNSYGLPPSTSPHRGNHRHGLARPLVHPQSQHGRRNPYGRS